MQTLFECPVKLLRAPCHCCLWRLSYNCTQGIQPWVSDHYLYMEMPKKHSHVKKDTFSDRVSSLKPHQLTLEDSGCWLGVGQWVLQKRIRHEPKSVVPCGSQVLSQWGLRVSGLRFTVSPRAITSCFAGGRFCPFGLGPMATTRHGYGSKVIGLSQK